MAENTASLLTVDSRHPRYLGDGTGRPVLLAGSHTWTVLQDIGVGDDPQQFDYTRFLDFLSENGHNVFRLWVWEQAKWIVSEPQPYRIRPLPFSRTGPGWALDGKPKFDLTELNENYFARMRERILAAKQRGIYVSVMLFNGFSVEKEKGHLSTSNPWLGHPFNRQNNINGIDGDPGGENSGGAVHTLRVPAVTAIQEAYVRKVIDTVNELDNVLFEISNESHALSTEWQYHMIRFVKTYEATKPKQHPVGMTAQWPGGRNAHLFASPADWISPNQGSGNYLADPRPADGRKVIVVDTDHLCGICGDRRWAWKSFTRGLNPIFMDPYGLVGDDFENPTWVSLRRNLGYIRRYASRMNLAAALPRPNLCSTRFCLANTKGGEYLVYSPEGKPFAVDLTSVAGTFAVEWFHPATGDTMIVTSITGGTVRMLEPPFEGDAVLYLARSSG